MFSREDVIDAAMSRFEIGASDMGDPWIRCKYCQDVWDLSGETWGMYKTLLDAIHRAIDHFKAGCK
jgi:hypothetical protein